MSSSKKTLLLKKLAKQKANMEKNMFKLPTFKLSAGERKAKAKRSFVPTIKSIAKGSLAEEKMRNFFEKLIDLEEDDLIELNEKDEIDNDLASSGFEEMVKKERKSYPELDEDSFREVMFEKWDEMSDISKKVYIMEAYGNEEKAEWGRKTFMDRFLNEVGPKRLPIFIRDYLRSDLKYKDFYDHWLDTTEAGAKVVKYQEKLMKREFEESKERKGIVEIKTPSLTKDEKQFLDLITQVESKKYELSQWPKKRLVLHASSKGIKNPQLKDKSELVTLLINRDFPIILSGEKDFRNIKLSRDTIENIIRNYMTQDQVEVFGEILGLGDLSGMSKSSQIHYIMTNKYPRPKRKKTQLLVDQGFVSGWNYKKRKEELQKLPSKDLKKIGYISSLNISSDSDLIENILRQEEYRARLIPKEEMDKRNLAEKIARITGRPKENYSTWSLADLNQRFDIMKEEENWPELERERMIKKLGDLIDLKSIDYKNWSNSQIAKKLEDVAGADWENYRPLVEDYSFVKCMGEYNLEYPWINGNVTAVWLTGPKGFKPAHKYIEEDVTIEEYDVKWYQANRHFFKLQCNDYKRLRTQVGTLLTCIEQDGKKISFQVGYTVKNYKPDKKYIVNIHDVKNKDGKLVRRTFIIQDEKLFREENRYVKGIRSTEYQKIQELLDDTVTKDSEDMAISRLSTALLSVAPTKTDYGVTNIEVIDGVTYKNVDKNTPFNQIVIKHLRTGAEQTNRDFFTRLANLLVYLKDIPEAKIFRERVKEEYYLPDILADLSYQDKFPEVFEDPKITSEYSDKITSMIQNKVHNMVNELGRNIYDAQDPTKRRRTMPSLVSYSKRIQTNRRINACSNKDRKSVVGATPDQIVYYKEDGKIYCFTIDELHNQFGEGDITNPETKNEFSMEFVNKFNNLYDKRLSREGLLSHYYQKKYGFDLDNLVEEKIISDTKESKEPELAPNFWDKIGKDISELENELTNEPPKEGEIVDEKREEEKRGDVKITTEEACEYCKKFISDSTIKTLIRHDKESRIIKFCSFKCFENKEDWRKFKRKRRKEEKKKVEEYDDKEARRILIKDVVYVTGEHPTKFKNWDIKDLNEYLQFYSKGEDEDKGDVKRKTSKGKRDLLLELKHLTGGDMESNKWLSIRKLEGLISSAKDHKKVLIRHLSKKIGKSKEDLKKWNIKKLENKMKDVMDKKARKKRR